MKVSQLLLKSLLHYRGIHVSVAASVAVCTAVLVGALIVGDSVRYSLVKTAEFRLGDTRLAMVRQDGFFTDKLAGKLSMDLEAEGAGILYLTGSVSTGDGSRVVNQVNVYGIDANFYNVMGTTKPTGTEAGGKLWMNTALAQRLGVSAGEELILTAARPGEMAGRDALSSGNDPSASFRMTAGEMVSRENFGWFALRANQSQPLNVFVDLAFLQRQLDLPGKVNLCLMADTENKLTVEQAEQSIKRNLSTADLGLGISQEGGLFRIQSDSVFIPEPIVDVLMEMDDDAAGILTYFVNEISTGERSTPYSMVSAVSETGVFRDIVPGGENKTAMPGITLTDWIAEDLQAGPGDSLTIAYYVLTDDFLLEQREHSFVVDSIVPISAAGVDASLMPAFPGLQDVDNCRDWSSPVPIDFARIRDKDEQYWDDYQGTPKAFVNLDTGQKLWAGRYGSLTEVRIPGGGRSKAGLSKEILSKVNPAAVGLFFADVREPALRGASGSTDFGQLFLGLSMFLIFSAVILIALTFALGIESRVEQIGLLTAVGIPFSMIRRLYLCEGIVIAVVGAAAGVFLGIGYTKVLIWALNGPWGGAIAGADLFFHAGVSSLWIGGLSSIVLSIAVVWLRIKSTLKTSAVQLLAGGADSQFFAGEKQGRGILFLRAVYAVLLFGAVVMVYLGLRYSGLATGSFFAAGGLLLVGMILLTMDILKSVITSSRFALKCYLGLAIKNAGIKPGRSLAVIALIASGTFMVTAVGINGDMQVRNPRARESGTGGFELYARSSIGIVENVNSEKGRAKLGLSFEDIDVEFIQCRLHEGDDASCLNLNRPQKPSVLGVDSDRLAELCAFSFSQVLEGKADDQSPWELLRDGDPDDTVVPAIADYATLTWSLGKKVGDVMEYRNGKGENISLQFVAAVKNSILQGSVIISNQSFMEQFPDDYPFRVFLVDVEPADSEGVNEVSNTLSRRLQDYGLESISTSERLGMFQRVQNTYISIFQLLGGLGIVLGTIGLGFIVIRNVLGRMGELAMIWAIGTDRREIRNMVFCEHILLLIYGAVAGLVTAVVAAYPAAAAADARVPVLGIGLMVAAIMVSGAVWAWLAVCFALRGDLMGALRNE